jgi:enoyl-CoA hydratase
VRGGWGKPLREALRDEFAGGLDCLEQEGVAGAGRFAAGKGRHGDFGAV